MSHRIMYDPETQIVEVKTRGDVFPDEIKEIYSEAMQVAAHNNACLFLSDYSEAQMRLSTLDVYGLPKTFVDTAAALGLNPYRLKRAIIPSQRSDDFRFYENVSANRGQSAVRIFKDPGEAKKWLCET